MSDMQDDVRAALDRIAAHGGTWDEEVLASAVRELQGENFDTTMRYQASEELRLKAEAALAALRAEVAQREEAAFRDGFKLGHDAASSIWPDDEQVGQALAHYRAAQEHR